MTGPPDGKVPAQGARRDSTHHLGDQLDQKSGLALQHKASVEHVTDIDSWPALAAWLGAVR
jgi:hypothetical protein